MSVGYYVMLFGATFVGVSIGHSLIRGLFGTGRREAPQQHPAQASPCSNEAQDFAKCLDYSSSNIKNCQIYMDLLEDCQRKLN